MHQLNFGLSVAMYGLLKSWSFKQWELTQLATECKGRLCFHGCLSAHGGGVGWVGHVGYLWLHVPSLRGGGMLSGGRG